MDSGPGQEIGNSKHILILDNDQDICETIFLLLQAYGHQATVVTTKADAWDALEQGPFDMLILDGIGLDLCKVLRRTGFDIPIIFLSGHASQSDIAAGIEAGAQAYLTKPFDSDELEQTILRLIGYLP